MSNINVAIADDNEQIRQNLQEIISKEKDMTLYDKDKSSGCCTVRYHYA